LGPVITNENGLQQTIGTVLLVEDITKEKELDRMKTELVTLASHQLRTPASAVKNTLSLLLDGYVGTFSAEQLRNLRQAYAENQFELKLIDGIIEVGEVDTNQVLINPTQVDLAKLMTGIVNDNQTFIKERKHRVTIDIPAATIVQADADKIRRVFERLITNAIQYTGPRGRIQIAAERSGSDVIITVSDTGIGVPAAELPDLFNRFSRASNAIKTNMAGPGLGLYLAKSIIELHHGHIELESQLGKGTIVRVTLPTK
jgi:two-component system phosphate regulon sensor histidine kinase PhoR